jgi:cytochrome b561
LTKELCSMGSKCLAWGAGHMCRKKSYQKTCLVVHWNSFLEFLGIFAFLVINQNIHTQLCMNVKRHHHHMNYLTLDYSVFFTCFK